MFILDTNVVSELRKVSAGRADGDVSAWAAGVESDRTFLSVITILELEQGVIRIERLDPRQGSLLRSWLEDRIVAAFANRIFPLDIPIARRCAGLHVPDPRQERDAMIAATALVHGMTVVTRNGKDFAGTGVPILNPWHPA